VDERAKAICDFLVARYMLSPEDYNPSKTRPRPARPPTKPPLTERR
jgi:hypothetical protein